jgi:signal peptidase II
MKRISVVAIILFATIGCDQTTKLIAKTALKNTPPQIFLHNIFRLEYAENTGAFLSFGAALPERFRFLMFTFGVGLFLAGALYYVLKNKVSRINFIGLCLLIGGGLGNLIDRIFYGRVIDFMNFGIGDLRTGIFNVADVAVVVAIALLFLDSLQKPALKSSLSQN